MPRRGGKLWAAAAAVAGGLALAGSACRREWTLPTESELREIYGAGVSARVTGNVAEIVVRQPREHLRRGGSLWARVGPYIYLLSPQTRELFERYPDLAAVRVITRLPDGREVARGTLVRDTLPEGLWPRAIELAARARLEGSEHPQRLDDLVRWGERYVRYRYSYSATS